MSIEPASAISLISASSYLLEIFLPGNNRCPRSFLFKHVTRSVNAWRIVCFLIRPILRRPVVALRSLQL